jgi:glucose uptake protein
LSAILYALVTVLTWGTWMTPSQNIHFKNQQIKTFYVATANLLLTGLVLLIQGASGLTWQVFWLPFIGGLIWALSAFAAFTATKHLGMARAFGIWTPLNVLIGIGWGMLLFSEFLKSGPLILVLLGMALVILIAGILLIIFAKGFNLGREQAGNYKLGLLGAFSAGILWGSYFIPIKISAASMWVASFPMAVGIFAGSGLLVLLSRQSLRLDNLLDTLRVSASGVMWGVGNYGMLLLVDQLGTGRGFTISQLGVVVNALMGIFVLKDPKPRSRAAILTLAGCILACIGAILLESLK